MNKNLTIVGVVILLILILGAVIIVVRLKASKPVPSTEEQTESIPEETLSEKETASIEEKTTECNVGMFIRSSGATFKVTGVEKHNIRGKVVDLCCAEVSEGTKKTVKMCNTSDNEYGITWTIDSKTGNLYKYMEQYKEGEKRCQAIFDEKGNVINEMCF